MQHPTVGIVKHLSPRRGDLARLVQDHRTHVHAINPPARGKRHARQFRDRRQQIHRRDKRIARRVRRNVARPPHHARHAVTAFIRRPLRSTKRLGAAAMFSSPPRRPIVRRENNIGILRQSQIANSLDHPAHLGINLLDHRFIRLGTIRIVQIRGNIQRHVRHGMRQIQEKRFLRFTPVFLDEFDGFVRIATGDRPLIHGAFDYLFPFHQRRLPLLPAVFLPLPLGRPGALFPVVRVGHVVGIGNAKIGVKPLFRRQKWRAMP